MENNIIVPIYQKQYNRLPAISGEEQVDGIGEVGDRASEGQAAGVYGVGFTAGY